MIKYYKSRDHETTLTTNKMGQKTGISVISVIVHTSAKQTALVALYQNLNSGKRLMNGRNSSSLPVGKEGCSSSNCSSLPMLSISIAGTNFGVRKAKKMFSR